MIKPYTFLASIAVLALAVCCAQGPSSSTAKLSGTIDGRPTPDKTFQFNRYFAATRFISTSHRLPTADEEQNLVTTDTQRQICGNLQTYIGAAAHQSEILRLQIVPTKADIDEVASHTIGVSEAEVTAAYPKRRALATTLATGFADVLDKGQDPHAVYQQVIAPAGLNGITEDGWLGLLYTARATPEGRERLERDSKLTMQNMIDEANSKTAKSAASTGPGGLADLAADNLVKQRADQIIAMTDPTFRNYLAEFPDPYHWTGNGAHHQYLEQKRNDYWTAVRSKLNVWLSDPTLFDTCKLAAFGITVVKK